jgi:hypothetical protein
MARKKTSTSKRVPRKRGRRPRSGDEPSGHARIFISYSHEDTSWMERFRRELNAALFKKATVWCDKDIGRGTDWENRLAAELDRAEIALVLATTEYLQSRWCRRELEYVCGKFKEKRIGHVFWVEIKPCAWKQTELATFERSGSMVGRSLIEIADENERNREVVRIVEEICLAVEEGKATQKPDLLTAKTILGDEAFKHHISLESVISNEGDFAIVCRGRDGSHRDVAIKVMRRSPITGILDNLGKVAARRQDLRDPGFIRLYDSFMVKSPFGDHLVLIMEYFDGPPLRKALGDKSLSVDHVVSLVRRAGEALRELHEVDYAQDHTGIPGLGFGPMIPEHLFYDQRLDRVRFPAISISNFAWDVLGWKKFATLVDNDSERYAAPEQIAMERAAAKTDRRKIDQYMLGQLAVEMLDRRLPLGRAPTTQDLDRKIELLDEPLRHAGSWKSTHPQLERIVARMLARHPQARWGDVDEIVTALKAVESSRRAVAKAAYMKWVEPDEESFFKEFYKRFFASGIAKREKSERKFVNKEQQYDKLRKGMAAVLNFYPGNEPTSMHYVIKGHRDKGVTEDELVQFEAVFLQLLQEWLDERMKRGDEMAPHKSEIVRAWRELFGQVLSYFREQRIDPGSTTAAQPARP